MAQTAGVALIDIGQPDGAAGHLLHLFCERSDLGSVALVRSRDLQHQQVAQGVDRDLDLRAFAPFGSIVASPRSRLRGRLQRAAVKTDRGGLAFFARPLTQDQLHVGDQRLKTTDRQPAIDSNGKSEGRSSAYYGREGSLAVSELQSGQHL